MNQLHAVALNEGLRCKKRCGGRRAGRSWSRCPRSVGQPTAPGPARLARSVHAEDPGTDRGWKRWWRSDRWLDDSRTHPGVGPLTALAFEFIIGTPERFQCAKQIASYVGTGPVGRLQRRSASTGPHQQTGQRPVALLAGGSGAGDDTQRSVAQPFFHLASDEGARSRKSRWHGGWRSTCIGCGGEAGTTKRCNSSVRRVENSSSHAVATKGSIR